MEQKNQRRIVLVADFLNVKQELNKSGPLNLLIRLLAAEHIREALLHLIFKLDCFLEIFILIKLLHFKNFDFAVHFV
jgi:hypothetical protein